MENQITYKLDLEKLAGWISNLLDTDAVLKSAPSKEIASFFDSVGVMSLLEIVKSESCCEEHYPAYVFLLGLQLGAEFENSLCEERELFKLFNAATPTEDLKSGITILRNELAKKEDENGNY